MRGLIRNNFYAMESNLKIAFVLAAFLAVSPILITDEAFLPMILAAQIFLFVLNTGTSLHADEIAKWNSFELTLPVKRSTIVGAKYCSFALLVCFGLIMGTATIVCAHFSNITLQTNSVLWGYEYGLVLSVITVSLMYPVLLKTGTEKNELILLLSALAAIGILLLTAFCLSGITGGMNLRHPLVGAVSTCLALLLFVVSFFVSVSIHQRKEF